MKSGKITAVVAVRKGSQRVPNKNIKPFGDTTLLDLKLQTLLKVSNLDEIIVNTDCDKMIEIGKSYGVKTQKRDEYFASSEASNSEFHGHIGGTTDTANTGRRFYGEKREQFLDLGEVSISVAKCTYLITLFFDLQTTSTLSSKMMKRQNVDSS